ncbi:proline-rich membrane anchor 1 isoform X1 [Phyllostomus discolor]|uniref:Proline-rich membrane anchor 1 isoform X1 n=1 Tax=Phyllostomus discolor TaxID=89673 RepID=A0A7E6CRH1_9CHIR|nr:proline-rich membrane anchor 1 isoform X1 [Phyllostomus discolor]
MSAQFTTASLDGDQESLQQRWRRRRRRRRGARAGALPAREAGEALAKLTSVFLFRALFISPPPAALLPERTLPAGVSRRCLSGAGVTDEESFCTPAPWAAARRHREGRGPGEGTRCQLPAARKRLSPPPPPPRQPALALGAGCRPSRPARGQAQPGATAPCTQCERAAPGTPAQRPRRPKPHANFCSSARCSSQAREAPKRPRSRSGDTRRAAEVLLQGD